MTTRERCMNILHYKSADRMPAVHFGYWKELLLEWAEQGHISKELADGARKDGSPAQRELDRILGWDCNWHNTVSANQGLLMATALEQMAEEAGLESGKKASLAVYNIYEKDTTGQSSQNFQVFNDDILTGKSIILALSPTLYTHLLENNGGIVALDEYLPSEGGENITFVDDSHRGIKLSSLPLYQKEGWKDLPEDTVLCLRSPISLANIFNSEKAQKNYIIYETLFRYILAEPLAEEA